MPLTRSEKSRFIRLAKEKRRREKTRRLLRFVPYPKQLQFYADGREFTERLLMAGNQQGKTLSAAAEVAMHLTGRYPKPGQFFYPEEDALRRIVRTADPDSMEFMHALGFLENLAKLDLFGADAYPNGWQGRRFTKPISVWAAGKSSRDTRDIVQKELMGDPGDPGAIGTGMIPLDDIVTSSITKVPNVSNAIDSCRIRHASGGYSSLGFKSYDQGRERFQGVGRHVMWFDEEPPFSVYMEGITRTNAVNGICLVTFTPLLGHSEVVRLFIHGEEDLIAA